MNIPSTLTDRLLEFVLDNHTSVLVCSTLCQDELRGEERQSLRTGIEDILVDALEDPKTKAPPAQTATESVEVAAQEIWDRVLSSFDDNIWLDNDERIVFFARWETDLKEQAATILTRLLEDT